MGRWKIQIRSAILCLESLTKGPIGAITVDCNNRANRAAMMGVDTVKAVASSSYIKFVVTGFVGFILLCYVICVGEEECPVFLPMISNTWVYPPGNYISR